MIFKCKKYPTIKTQFMIPKLAVLKANTRISADSQTVSLLTHLCYNAGIICTFGGCFKTI